jgi:hypothetical protein
MSFTIYDWRFATVRTPQIACSVEIIVPKGKTKFTNKKTAFKNERSCVVKTHPVNWPPRR